MEKQRAQALALLAGNGAGLFLVVQSALEITSTFGAAAAMPPALIMLTQLVGVRYSYEALRHSDDDQFRRFEFPARLFFTFSVIGASVALVTVGLLVAGRSA